MSCCAIPAPLTTAREVKRLTAEDARRARSRAARGHRHLVIPEWNGFTLQDDTDGIYVAWTEAVAQPQSGAAGGSAGPGDVVGQFRSAVRAAGPDRRSAALCRRRRGRWQRLATGAATTITWKYRASCGRPVWWRLPVWSWPALALRIDLGGDLIWAYLRDSGDAARTAWSTPSVRVRGRMHASLSIARVSSWRVRWRSTRRERHRGG